MGVVSGIGYTGFALLKRIIRKKYISILLDIVFFCLLSVAYVYYSFCYHFPSFRVYMYMGVILGLALYIKSFYIILAKSIKKIYNYIKRKKDNYTYGRRKRSSKQDVRRKV